MVTILSNRPFNDTFLRACRKEPVDYIPAWYMRQAGRYQPEYRKIRESYSLFDITHHPDICAQVTRLPVEQLGVDAAILFADIMTPLQATGVDVAIKSGVGPVISHPIREQADVNSMQQIDPDVDVPYVIETVQQLREQLHVPLIGFAGAPFTLASYLIEGGPSKNYHRTKSMIHAKPDVWQALMKHLGDMTIAYLRAQIRAGASAVQIFDSWVGALSAEDYRQHIAPVMQRIIAGIKAESSVPIIYFGVGAGHLLSEWRQLDVDVIGLDWRTRISSARQTGMMQSIQGNLDPSMLLAPWQTIEHKTKQIIDEGIQEPGFIFNLGHGVFPDVESETLRRLTRFVHDYSKSNKA